MEHDHFPLVTEQKRVRTPPLYRTIGADFNTYAVSLQNLFDEYFVEVREASLFKPVGDARTWRTDL